MAAGCARHARVADGWGGHALVPVPVHPGHRRRRGFNQAPFSDADKSLLLDLHPVLDRNLRRLEKHEEEVIARNSLHHSAEYPSHIVLPVIPRGLP